MNAINWFEIPATDFDRAVSFYSAVLDVEILKTEFMGEPQAFFPASKDAVSGAIVKSDRLSPSSTGTLIYLNVGNLLALEQAMGKVEINSGRTLMEITDIGEPGFIGIIADSEGNSIGLHAPKPTPTNQTDSNH